MKYATTTVTVTLAAVLGIAWASPVWALNPELLPATEPVATRTGSAPQSTPAVVLVAQAFEEINAAPVMENSPGDASNVTEIVDLEETEEDEDTKPWRLSVGLRHSLSSAALVQDTSVRDANTVALQSWSFGGSYRFGVGDHTWTASMRFPLSIELTEPNRNPARRWNPGDTSLSLRDNELWTIPVLDVNLSAGAQWTLPTSYNSINSTRRWGALGLSLGASRKVKIVSFNYGFGFSKNFNKSKVPQLRIQTARTGELSEGNPNSSFQSSVEGNAAQQAALLDGTSSLPFGFANTSFSFSNSLGISVALGEHVTAGYSVALINVFSYDLVDRAGEFNELDVGGDAGRGRTDLLSPSLSVSWAVSEGLGLDLPFTIGATAGLSATHPAKSADNDRFIWPFFYNSVFSDRAANNFGAVYLGLNGTY